MTGIWIVTLLKRDKVQVVRQQRREFQSKQPIWCPIVPNTYFVARREGKVFVTGNTPIQWLANCFALASMTEAVRWTTEERPEVKVVMTVHDEIVFECPEVMVEEVVTTGKRIMLSWPSGVVNLKVGAEAGSDWGHMVAV